MKALTGPVSTGKAEGMQDLPDLSDLAHAGARLWCRVTPSARRDGLSRGPDGLRITVTAAPEKGKANRAVIKILAKALGVPKSRLRLLRGETGRDKLFEIGP